MEFVERFYSISKFLVLHKIIKTLINVHILRNILQHKLWYTRSQCTGSASLLEPCGKTSLASDDNLAWALVYSSGWRRRGIPGGELGDISGQEHPGTLAW